MKANDSTFLSKVLKWHRASVHHVPCPKERKKEPKMNERVHVLQKLDILFGLNTPIIP
jgi:hypothetical protein